MIIVQLDTEQLSNLIQSSVREVLKETVFQSALPTDQAEQLLTVQDTAKFLSLSVPTVYSLISKGQLPVMKRSKRCYFSKLELINYLKQGRKKTIAEIASEAENYVKKKGGKNV